MFGTIPDYDRYHDYDRYLSELIERGDAMGMDGHALAHKYIAKDFVTRVKHRSGSMIHYTTDKSSILPKVYHELGAGISDGKCEIEFMLKKIDGMPIPESVFDQPNVHNCDANIKIPRISPCDIIYIDYETIMYIDRYNKLRAYDLVIKLCDDFMPIMKPHAMIVIDDPHALFDESSEKMDPPINHSRIQMRCPNPNRPFQKVLEKKQRVDIASAFKIVTDGNNEYEQKFLQCCRWFQNKHTMDYTLVLRRV